MTQARKKEQKTINFSHLNILLLLLCFFSSSEFSECEMPNETFSFIHSFIFLLHFRSSFIGGAINATKEDLGDLFLGRRLLCLLTNIENRTCDP